MPLIALNGIEVPVLVGSFSKGDPEVIGERTRSLSGTMRTTHVATKRRWSASLSHRSTAEADAWRRLLLFDWDVVSFDSTLYSAKGSGPSASAGTPAVSTTRAKFGARSLAVSDVNGASYRLAAVNPTYTIMVWRWDGAAWDHHVITSAGDEYLNGVAGTFAAPGLAQTGGEVSLGSLSGTAATATTYYFDDLVLLPFAVPSEWVADIYAAGAAFTGPALTATGDGIEGAPRYVVPQVGQTSTVGAWVDGTFQAVEVLSVELEEE